MAEGHGTASTVLWALLTSTSYCRPTPDEALHGGSVGDSGRTQLLRPTRRISGENPLEEPGSDFVSRVSVSRVSLAPDNLCKSSRGPSNRTKKKEIFLSERTLLIRLRSRTGWVDSDRSVGLGSRVSRGTGTGVGVWEVRPRDGRWRTPSLSFLFPSRVKFIVPRTGEGFCWRDTVGIPPRGYSTCRRVETTRRGVSSPGSGPGPPVKVL